MSELFLMEFQDVVPRLFIRMVFIAKGQKQQKRIPLKIGSLIGKSTIKNVKYGQEF